jgi:hypothetical protein
MSFGATLAVTEITPCPSHQHQWQTGDVVAAVDGEVGPRGLQMLQELAASPQVGGRVLDADDAGNLREAQNRIVREIGDGAARHVVQQQRQIDFLGDRAEVPVRAFLRRLVVIRDDGQRAVRARLLRVRGERDGFGGGVAAGSAITGMRPRVSTTAALMRRQCSSTSTVGDSPVVPTTTMPAVPLAT